MLVPIYLVLLISKITLSGFPDKLIFNDSSAGQSIQTVNSPVTFAWTPAISGPAATGFRLTIDNSNSTNVGNVTQYTMPLTGGNHHATVAAYNADGYSPESVPLDFIVSQPPPPPGPCDGHPVSIAVKDWTNSVQVGTRGTINFDLVNPFPITQIQVRIVDQAAGVLVGSQTSGSDLRDTSGLHFNVPRNSGTYSIGLWATDSSNCIGQTTTPRTITITP